MLHRRTKDRLARVTPTGGSTATAVETVILAVVVFATTNVDDLVLLTAFFSDAGARPRAIVLGQLVGMGVLVGASAAAAFGAMALPAPWVALTGAVPLVMGVRKVLKLRSPPAVDDAAPTSTLRDSSRVLTVAAVTIANGGDNVGVYIPLFASHPSATPAYVAVFGVMTVVWCGAAWSLVRSEAVGARIRRFGRVVLPVVLIAIGLHVLRGTVPLFE